jgi:ubiquinone/menaquinone biosynthesis C-methylase UbiE
VLDIGCGTGTFAMLIKQLYPNIEVTGVDPDPKALARAQRKAKQAAVSIHFDRGFADALEYPAASFDRVFSCFMFHHLPADAREKTLREVRRVLVPGGSFHLLDFAGPDAHAHGSLSRLLHSSDHLKDNSESRILGLLNQAAFVNPRKVTDGAMLLGLLRTAYYQAFVP